MFLFSSFLFGSNLEADRNTIQPQKKTSESLECCFSLAHSIFVGFNMRFPVNNC